MSKKNYTKPPEPIRQEKPKTIPCPVHGQPLVLERKDGRLVAVCTCNVPDNKYAGKEVYERIGE